MFCYMSLTIKLTLFFNLTPVLAGLYGTYNTRVAVILLQPLLLV